MRPARQACVARLHPGCQRPVDGRRQWLSAPAAAVIRPERFDRLRGEGGAIEPVPLLRDVSDWAVTTTQALNFRAGPGGARFGTLPEGATVSASARTAGWFQVEYRGMAGWISADYVVAAGVCG
ncbi:MAG: SH3 domain-containing protein [Boseongicola sp. SB0677_bin_26]|nr:SH3 domain-containing protein [Boseongicola sp. SB0677_bin_26]